MIYLCIIIVKPPGCIQCVVGNLYITALSSGQNYKSKTSSHKYSSPCINLSYFSNFILIYTDPRVTQIKPLFVLLFHKESIQMESYIF